ncbi:cytochrome P450 [Xylariales sp. PMI_506]|nr:cytochrome P450 [Xylariales sp. PMI_506]
MSLSLTSVLLLAVAVWLLVKVIRGLYIGPLSKVPGPKAAAVTYLDEFYHQAIRDDWSSYLESLHKRYGPIVRINPNEVSILDHDFSYVFFNQRNLDKEERYFQLAPRSTATMTPHSEHKMHRDIIMPLFNGNTMRELGSVSIPPTLAKLSARLGQYARSGEPLNLTHLMWACSNDIFTKYIFGFDLDLLDQDDLVAGYKLRSFQAIRLASIFRQWPLVLLFKIRDLPLVRNVAALPIESLVRRLNAPLYASSTSVSEAKKQKGVAQMLYESSSIYRDPLVLDPECAEFMLGGTEAVTYNLIHVFHKLMSRPDIVNKLRKEMDDLGVHGGNVWDDSRVPSLPYLNAVIKEALRLNDSGSIRFVRQSKVPVTYGSFVLPPYTTISMSERLINWDPSISHPLLVSYQKDGSGTIPQQNDLRSCL